MQNKKLDAKSLRKQVALTNDPSLWSDYGVALTQEKRYHAAKAAFERSIAIDPSRAASHFNLGNLLFDYNFFDDAIKTYEHAIEIDPSNADFYLNYGNALRQMGHLAEAKIAYQKAISLEPEKLVTRVNLGNLLIQLNYLNNAEEVYREVLTIEPNHVPALIGIGNALCQLKKYDEAEEYLTLATKVMPSSAEGFCNLSNIYLARHQPETAAKYATKALKLRPNFVEALSNYALAKKELGELDEAIKYLKKAIKINPNFTPGLSNLAVILKAAGKLKEALDYYLLAMKSSPSDPVPAYNASLMLLQLGEFKYGWELYENRWLSPNFDSPNIKTQKPRWDGKPTQDPILVWPEQGIGDEVMFGSLFEQVYQSAPNAIFMLDKRLINIFKRSLPNLRFQSKEHPIPEDSFTYHIPIGSLPKIYCNSIQDFNKIRPAYIKSDLKKTAALRDALQASGKKICGISWRSQNKTLGKARSLRLTELLDLIHLEDVLYLNLQYGDVGDDLNAVTNHKSKVMTIDNVDIFNDIDSLCSLIKACDYVVSIDNSTVHLSGALGVPTTVLLPRDPDWRWTSFTERSLWYPSVIYTS